MLFKFQRSKLIPFRENQNADLGAKNISHQYDGKLREYALFDAVRFIREVKFFSML